MKYCLAAIGISIYDNAITVFRKPVVARDIRAGEKQVPEHALFIFRRFIERIDMPTGHDQNMRRRLRLQVFKCDTSVILENPFRRDFTGNYPAENTPYVAHFFDTKIIAIRRRKCEFPKVYTAVSAI